jgi:hypothetical protein
MDVFISFGEVVLLGDHLADSVVIWPHYKHESFLLWLYLIQIFQNNFLNKVAL